MTISSTTRRAGPFAGNGVTTAFPFTFKVFAKTDVSVAVVDSLGNQTVLVLDSDYSVALNADQNANPGGTITYPLFGPPMPAGSVLATVGSLLELQPTDITNNGGFYPTVVEDSFDRAVILVQQLSEQLGRQLVVPVTDSSPSVELPTDIQRANKMLGFNSIGDPVVLIPVSGSAADVLIQLAQGNGGSNVGFGIRTVQAKLQEYVTVTDFVGVDKTGAIDSTNGLTTAFANGGEIHVPDGDYLIAAAGANNGGVSVLLSKSTRIICSPKARFFTNGLDNDLITFIVSAATPTGITLEWKGGIIDQTAQKNSTVMPFSTEYPPANPGTSATCDGLSIRGDTTVSGVPVSKIRRCVIEDVITYAGDHWHTAGGDSGIFLSGCEEQHALRIVNIGNRDCGIYASSDGTGTLVCRTQLAGNKHYNCFHGGAVKRSLGYASVVDSYAENCVRGFLPDLVAGTGFVGLDMRGNKGKKCNIFIRASKISGFSIRDNHFSSLGAVMDDGVTIVSINQDCIGIDLQGSTFGEVSSNTVDGLTAGAIAAFATECELLRSENYTDGTLSTKVLWRDNKGNGLRAGGTDTGDMNSFIDNVVFNALASANMTALGTNAWEQRQSPTTNVRQFSQQMLFADGTKSAPGLGRGATPSIGLRAATNFLALTIANNDRFAASSAGIGFNDIAPIGKPALGSAATDAGSTQTLANNIRTALINYGLCTA